MTSQKEAAAGSNGHLRIAVDIGGTFTDLAIFDEKNGELSFGKALSTHGQLVDGIQNTLNGAGANIDEGYLFLHGSTIAINTLLERNGARTALLITEGFRDIYEIGRVNRPDAYNLFFSKHEPLIPRSLRFEVPERLLADGSVHHALDEARVRELARHLKSLNVEAVAILLLHSYRNPAHEIRVREIVQEEIPGVFVTASHELSQEYREFERVSTAASNAYVGPRVSAYLGELEAHLGEKGFPGDFYAVQSTGGLFPVEHARRECVRMLESGPAAGVIGAQAICAQLGLGDAIAFDMGGTTAKAGVISEGKPLTSSSALIGGYEKALPIQIPMIDIFEVGTGGGSIARLEVGNALRVGPQSAGSIPGPVCYRRGGTEPTVTDANLILGRLDAENFLGGEMLLDKEGTERAMQEKVAGPLGLGFVEAADGILRIAVTAMSHAVKAVTTERGLDAGAFTMVVYGGAGPLHASAIARELGIRKVLIPFAPGYFSAYGMLFSDLRYDYVRSVFRKLEDLSFDEIEAIYREMEQEGRKALGDSAVTPESVEIERGADMRYVGQEHAVSVELPAEFFERQDRAAIKERFDSVHAVRYGTSAPAEAADLVSLRMTVRGIMRKPPRNAVEEGSATPPANALRATKDVYFRSCGGFVSTPVYRRPLLQSGNRVEGPALVEEHASTTVIQPGDVAVVDAYGNLQISIGSEQE
ncbi:N-methylhydantoinase A [Azotobacter beijerinckii]|uniref:N-methylhydantoinase A n=1 Tax=Azotobacter beijerinckii TaxID=170623 RepID=A0A1H6X8V3_9GAMM|nr:hydantoinase/oxoprolinase family protein [Azotobacter beijerinckii]SEI85176.1 N-methylhydantoinase A [Azotobacter beijerinckii]SEJ24496.1 N-methylhydantoinase A [Azotobacter beijerinckii]